jgi:hypothetical protein
MRRFALGLAGYLVACFVAILVIVLRGDGPHPRILDLYPRNGSLYFPGGPMQIAFSQAMDHATVESALQVTPGSQGQGAWFGNILNLQPIGDWKQNVTYHVSLTGKVTDTLGRPLVTPISFSFRVHRLQSVGFCSLGGIRNLCELTLGFRHALTQSPTPVVSYRLSDDGTELAFTRPDPNGLPHLFVLDVANGTTRKLTSGAAFSDGAPNWAPGDANSVTYRRRPVVSRRPLRLGRAQVWNVNIDGSGNLRLS